MQRDAARSLTKEGIRWLLVRHRGVPASTSICTSGGSQGMQVLQKKKGRYIAKLMEKVTSLSLCLCKVDTVFPEI